MNLMFVIWFVGMPAVDTVEGDIEKPHNSDLANQNIQLDETIYVKRVEEGGKEIFVGETVTTLKDPNGNIRKISTIETIDGHEGK